MLYIDGTLVAEGSYSGTVQVPPGTPLFIGGDVETALDDPDEDVRPLAGGLLDMEQPASCVISDFRVFPQPLSPDEIAP
jgi:hypothetical protein